MNGDIRIGNIKMTLNPNVLKFDFSLSNGTTLFDIIRRDGGYEYCDSGAPCLGSSGLDLDYNNKLKLFIDEGL